jgi:predicted Ser/Thr protein kinase
MDAFDAKTLGAFLTASKLLTQNQVQDLLAEVRDGNDVEEILQTAERKGLLTSLQTDKLRKGDRQGYFLGNYRVLYKIDSGSFARVYRADEPASGRIVAIKVLRNRWLESPEWLENFEREGRMGMSLRHPNIVEILSVGMEPTTRQPFIVMEFVEGGDLRDILKIHKRFSVAHALKILEDVAAALAYAFARGLTHRDMKLTNVLISSTGTAKVVDFGLAQIFSNRFITDDDATVARTVDYAGLEKATGAPLNDVRSDIYFIGCIAYEILSGRPPLLPSKTKMERMQRDRFLRVKPLELADLETPHPSLLRLVETMMAVDPAKRFQTPAQLLEAIKQLRQELGSAGRDPRGRDSRAGSDGAARKVGATVFVLEGDQRLQDAIRDKFKQLGYRVLISGDPRRAVDRFAQQPFPVLIVDASTTQNEGIRALDQVLHASVKIGYNCHGIVIASPEESILTDNLGWDSKVSILKRPVNMGQLLYRLKQVAPPPPSEPRT